MLLLRVMMIPGLINGTNLEKKKGGVIITHFQKCTKITCRLIAIHVKSFVPQKNVMSKYAKNMASQNDDTGFLYECKQASPLN